MKKANKKKITKKKTQKKIENKKGCEHCEKIEQLFFAISIILENSQVTNLDVIQLCRNLLGNTEEISEDPIIKDKLNFIITDIDELVQSTIERQIESEGKK
ncbi:MAG: hypothetical protein H7836_04545 [Magnetococcus sp. YQC-3]